MTARDAFGSRLRNHRERLGVTLESIAQTTKINRSLLAALERADLTWWPRGIYRCSFLQQYAAAIGLSPEALIREVAQLFPEPGQEPPLDDGIRLSLTVLPEPVWPARARQCLAAAIDSGAILVIGYGVSAFAGGHFWMALAAAGLSYHAAGTAVLGHSPASWCLSLGGLRRGGLTLVRVSRDQLAPLDIQPNRLDHQVTAVK